MSVEHSAAQEAANHVFFFLGPRINIFVDRQGTGADVIRDTPQTPSMLRVVLIMHGTDVRRRFHNGLEDVDVVVRGDALQSRRSPLEPHASVDVLARQRP